MDEQEHPRQRLFLRAPPSSWRCHTEAPSGRQEGPTPEPSFPGPATGLCEEPVPSTSPTREVLFGAGLTGGNPGSRRLVEGRTGHVSVVFNVSW